MLVLGRRETSNIDVLPGVIVSRNGGSVQYRQRWTNHMRTRYRYAYDGQMGFGTSNNIPR